MTEWKVSIKKKNRIFTAKLFKYENGKMTWKGKIASTKVDKLLDVVPGNCIKEFSYSYPPYHDDIIEMMNNMMESNIIKNLEDFNY